MIFIIKEENAQDFQEAVFSKLQGQIDYQVVYQKLEDVPEGFSVPEGRGKALGDRPRGPVRRSGAIRISIGRPLRRHQRR